MSTETAYLRPEGSEIEIKSLSLEEQIRRRAHQIWLENGSPEGTELIDWHEAEREILSEQERFRRGGS